MILALLGCAWLDEEELAHLRDPDGDGVPTWEDCAEGDATLPAEGYTDGDGDGWGGAAATGCDVVAEGGDCDDADAAVGGPATWYGDDDGDGHAAVDGEPACAAPGDAWSTTPGDDCRDDDAAVFPGAVEGCADGGDDDCDGLVDECDAADAGTVVEGLNDGLGWGDAAFVPRDGADELVLGRTYSAAVQGFDLAAGPVDLDSPTWGLSGAPTNTGSSLAVADFDGDGEPDVAAGAPTSDPAARVVVGYGPLEAGRASVDLDVFGEGVGSLLGISLAAGDLDRDGVADLVLGDPGQNEACGAAYLLHGPFPETGDSVDDWYGAGGAYRAVKLFAACSWPRESEGLGTSLLVLDEPGRDPAVAMGIPAADDRAGRTYVWTPDQDSGDRVFEGDDAATTRWDGTDRQIWSGYALAAGDLDDDGHLDLAIGAPYALDAEDDSHGAVFVLSDILGRAEGATLEAAEVRVYAEPSPDADNRPAFGGALAFLPADGPDTLVVGAPGWSDFDRGVDAGGVYTFAGGLGQGAHEAADAQERFYGAHASELVGATLDAGGDLDDDGAPELVVGAPGWVGESGSVTGAVLVLWGQ